MVTITVSYLLNAVLMMVNHERSRYVEITRIDYLDEHKRLNKSNNFNIAVALVDKS